MKAARHYLTNVDVHNLVADCAVCGPAVAVNGTSPGKVTCRARQLDYYRNRNLKRRYGIDHEEYDRLIELQSGACAICAAEVSDVRDNNLSVDHCHGSGRVRGLLCHQCNTGVAKFRDSPNLLRAAANYIELQ